MALIVATTITQLLLVVLAIAAILLRINKIGHYIVDFIDSPPHSIILIVLRSQWILWGPSLGAGMGQYYIYPLWFGWRWYSGMPPTLSNIAESCHYCFRLLQDRDREREQTGWPEKQEQQTPPTRLASLSPVGGVTFFLMSMVAHIQLGIPMPFACIPAALATHWLQAHFPITIIQTDHPDAVPFEVPPPRSYTRREGIWVEGKRSVLDDVTGGCSLEAGEGTQEFREKWFRWDRRYYPDRSKADARRY